jgi:arylsulfatase A-like enzyme
VFDVDRRLAARGCRAPLRARRIAPQRGPGIIAAPAAAQQKKPNIIMIMGGDVGWFNVGACHQGIMSGRNPSLDRLAAEGMRFTDYYAEARCTAGRANFITGALPIRTGLTTVGQAGSPIGMPAEAPTIATALKSMGYATGQFGKNHLGDLNQLRPTVHGFDEFYGYRYHLDAMEDPCHPNHPQELKDKVGPRNMVHSWATSVDDPTVQPRWGKIGKQKIEDAGELCPKRMETVDDFVGAVMKYAKDAGLEGDTIVGFTTDNGAENFTWPDGRQTPFAGGKGTAREGHPVPGREVAERARRHAVRPSRPAPRRRAVRSSA